MTSPSSPWSEGWPKRALALTVLTEEAPPNEVEQVVKLSDAERLREALEEMLGLANFLNDSDPWYAENEGLDAEAMLNRARAALTDTKGEGEER